MLIAFDLDGTLIDARDIHFECLNEALQSVGAGTISFEEHIGRFDGLPTKEKLRMLLEEGRLGPYDVGRVVSEKDRLTAERIIPFEPNERLTELFVGLRVAGHMTAIVSNAKRSTIVSVVHALHISPDCIVGGDDVAHKPSPEGYERAMHECNETRHGTIILEDAPVGKAAARASGARVIPVFDPQQLTLSSVLGYISGETSIDVVMPMAGDGKRFQEHGFVPPKPLIDVAGRSMAAVAVNTLDIPEARHILLPRADHLASHPGMSAALKGLVRSAVIVPVPSLTQGQASTVLLARHLIGDRPLVIANCDQSIVWDSDRALHWMISQDLDGLVLTFTCLVPDKRWSYVEIGTDGLVKRAAEKDPISSRALCGVFITLRGTDMIRAIDEMISADDRVNGEFYVSPALNRMVAWGRRIGEIPVAFSSLGTPELLAEHLGNF